MTTETTDPLVRVGARGRGRTGDFARGPVLLIAAAVAVVLAIASESAGYFFDELYFLVAGRDHLAWGYFDQPPLVPALAGLLDRVAPGSLLVFRLPVTLGAALTVVLVALIARELGGGRGAQVLAAGAVAVSGTVLMSHYLATYTVDPVLWTLLLWLLARWVRTRSDRLLLLAGVVTAVSLQTKFLVPALWVAVAIGVLLCGPREMLRRPALWAAAAIAVVATVPTLLWQAANGWPYAQMGAVVRDEWPGTTGFVLGVVLFAGAVGAPLVLVGLIRVGIALARPPHRHRAAWLAVALVGVCVAFALSGGRSYYTLAILPALIALGSVEVTTWARGRARRTRGTLAALGFTVGAAALLLSVPVLPDAWLAQIPGAPAAAVEAGERVMEPAAMAATAAYRALPDGTRGQTALFAEIYPLAAAVDVLGGRAGGPPPYSPHRGYGYFAPPPESQTNALWVGFETVPDTFRGYFADCAPGPADGLEVWLCTGRTTPWAAMWPSIRSR
jgi:4-amino-4-deoxy-L-arabinose transferase-like glycosyltransferase